GSSKNLMSFRCAVDLVGRLYNKSAGILTYFKDLLCKMTAEDTVQMDGVRFLEVPFTFFIQTVQKLKFV
ncbi:MAG: hypothetical protein VZR27_04415, partial [Acutalibacteraceae bacterium]|nr:hypothetical protein [Acutalibacteraceae bacterium]